MQPDDFVDDQTSLGRAEAGDCAQRMAALRWCLSNVWAPECIRRLERLDAVDPPSHGWAMWRQ